MRDWLEGRGQLVNPFHSPRTGVCPHRAPPGGHLADTPIVGFSTLRAALERRLDLAKQELKAREPERVFLNRLQTKGCGKKAKAVALEKNVCQRNLEVAVKALKGTGFSRNRLRASIAEPEPAPQLTISREVMRNLYSMLQQAGLPATQLHNANTLLGMPSPPLPPNLQQEIPPAANLAAQLRASQQPQAPFVVAAPTHIDSASGRTEKSPMRRSSRRP